MRKILFVTGKDVHNKAAYEIYKECILRGFEIDVFATTQKDGHTLLFDQIGVKIRSIYELDENMIMQYDYIFSAVSLFHIELFRKVRKYIFLNPSTYWDEIHFSGDFIFSVRDLVKSLGEEILPPEKLNYIKSLPAMASGGAMLIKHGGEKCVGSNVVRKILFVDAGHFPFGTKKELADYIVEIANYCSNCEVRFKPRYLPDDIDTSHKNKENVMTYLDTYKELPHNLVIIREHTDYQQELADCDLVICSEGTTSYVEAILHSKKLLIFTGFPSNEGVLWTNRRRQRFLKINSQINNRVYYKDIFQYLPEGIETTGDELDGFLYKTENVAESIVDAMEYIYENGLKHEKFPKRELYKIDYYLDNDVFDNELTWDDVIEKRYKTLVYDNIGSKMFRLCSVLNIDNIIDYIESQKCDENNLDVICERATSLLYDIYIDNSENMMEDAYSQSFLCLGYFKKGRFNEFKPNVLKCVAYYNYCRAKIEYDNGNYMEALHFINLFFDEVDSNLYEISYADDEGVKVMAHYYKGAALYGIGKKDEAKVHLLICDKAWNGTHKKARELLMGLE